MSGNRQRSAKKGDTVKNSYVVYTYSLKVGKKRRDTWWNKSDIMQHTDEMHLRGVEHKTHRQQRLEGCSHNFLTFRSPIR